MRCTSDWRLRSRNWSTAASRTPSGSRPDPLESKLSTSLGLDRLEDGGEQAPLAVEVVIERPPGDPGRDGDLLAADVLEPALGEQPAAGVSSAARVASRRWPGFGAQPSA